MLDQCNVGAAAKRCATRGRRPSEQPTQPIPPETLAECARRWREELERKGLVGGRS